MAEVMGSDFSKIYSKLKSKKILPNKASLKRYLTQGFMGDVYTFDSNIGRLVLHVKKINKGQAKQKVWEKISAIGNFLDSFPEIPTAAVLLSDTVGERYFTVQKMLEGRIAGERILKRNLFVDVRRIWSKRIEKDVEKIIARIHQIPVKGYGWISKQGQTIKGNYKSWDKFLENGVNAWAKSIRQSEGNSALAEKLVEYFKINKKKFIIKESFLVHGDIINPGNILISGGKVTGFIDWEWSLAGDPAWEFAFNNRYPLDSYFNSFEKGFSREEKEWFLERAKLYEPLILMLWLHIRVKNKTPEIYQALRNHLAKLGF